VIDLSTLIAVLTALASATSSPTAPDLPDRAPDPPGRTCLAPASYRTGAAIVDSSSESSGSAASRNASSTTEESSDRSDDADSDSTDSDSTDSDTSDSDSTDSDSTDSDGSSSETEDPAGSDARKADPDRASPRSESSSEDSTPQRRAPSRTAVPDDSTDEPSDAGSRAGSATDQYPAPRSSPTSPPRPRDGRGCADPSDSGRPAPAAARVPADLVDLDNWYLTLPTGADGDPDTVQAPRLAAYSSSFFEVNESKDGVVLTAPVDGVTTKNSSYPRSELREMAGEQEAKWSNGSGTHTLRATEAVTELPPSKPEVVAAQIHGGDDDVLQIRLEGRHLMVQYADGAEQVTLDPDYQLGTPYDIEIVAADNSVQVGYNGVVKADLPLSGSTWYFKAGAYVQSNPSKGDATTAAGQVIIYSLEVIHDQSGAARAP
jgi:hypothetical protein